MLAEETVTKKHMIPDPPPPGMLGKLVRLMHLKRNVLLIGTHGVGKTGMCLNAADLLKYRMRTFSASTMEPYADFGGIPIADSKSKTIEFFHDMDLDKYDIFFIDEINRPSHIKVLNGLLEIVQFFSVQGRKFKRLKMVWAAMNPPNSEYNVDDIDPTLFDRFHHFIEVPSDYIISFYQNKFGIEFGKILCDWAVALNVNKVITPRRLEYIGDAIVKSNGEKELVLSSVMPGTLEESDIKILLTKLAPLLGQVPIGNNKANTIMTGLIGQQTELTKRDILTAKEKLDAALREERVGYGD